MKKSVASKKIRKRPTGVSSTPIVRGHFGFWMETPDGHDVHILGDPKMPARTIKALGAMMDAAYKAAKAGKLGVPSNAGTQRPGSPDGSLATETRKPGSLK